MKVDNIEMMKRIIQLQDTLQRQVELTEYDVFKNLFRCSITELLVQVEVEACMNRMLYEQEDYDLGGIVMSETMFNDKVREVTNQVLNEDYLLEDLFSASEEYTLEMMRELSFSDFDEYAEDEEVVGEQV